MEENDLSDDFSVQGVLKYLPYSLLHKNLDGRKTYVTGGTIQTNFSALAVMLGGHVLHSAVEAQPQRSPQGKSMFVPLRWSYTALTLELENRSVLCPKRINTCLSQSKVKKGCLSKRGVDTHT